MKTTEIISEIVRNSSECLCGNISYDIEGDHVIIWSTNNSIFHSTSIITKLSAFHSYLDYRNDRVELNVF